MEGGSDPAAATVQPPHLPGCSSPVPLPPLPTPPLMVPPQIVTRPARSSRLRLSRREGAARRVLILGRQCGQEAVGTTIPSRWGGLAGEREQVGFLLVWSWGLQGLFHLVSGVCCSCNFSQRVGHAWLRSDACFLVWELNQSEQRREHERMEKFLQKQSRRVEKQRQKEGLRKEKLMARQMSAWN